MKKIAALLPIFAALIFLSAPVAADSPTVTVKDYNLSETVSPGDEFGLTVALDNTGEEIAEDVDVQLKASYPVSVRGLDKKHIDEIRENWDEPKLGFKLELEDGASEGNYPVQLVISYQDSDDNHYTENYVVNIPVEGRREAALRLSGSSKTDIYSDESTVLIFQVLNKGSVDIDSLVAESSSEGPLEVKWSSKQSVIGKLPVQESKKFKVKVEANKTAETGEYPVKVRLEGENFGLEKSFKIPVKGKPDFEATGVQSGKLRPDSEDVPVTVRLANNGGNLAEEIEGKLLAKYPFSTKATTKFIQSVPKKGNGTMTFRVDVDEDSDPGNYSVDLSLNYEADGEDFSKTLEVPLQVKKSETLAANYWWTAPLALVVLGGIFAIQRRKNLLER